jgi:hypothetical protein
MTAWDGWLLDFGGLLNGAYSPGPPRLVTGKGT